MALALLLAIAVTGAAACSDVAVDPSPAPAGDDASADAAAARDAAPPDNAHDAALVKDATSDAATSCIFGTPAGSAAAGSAPANAVGTRLHLRHLDLDDGTKLPWDFHDATLDVFCRPLAYPDGTVRCVPEGASSIPDASLVTFTSARTPFVPGVDAVVRVGADGTRLWLGELYDVEHGGPAVFDDALSVVPGTYALHPWLQIERAADLWSLTECCSTSLPSPCYQRGAEFNGFALFCPQVDLVMRGPAATDHASEVGHVFAAGAPLTEKYCIPASPLDASTEAGDCPAPTHSAVSGAWSVGKEIDPRCFLRAQTTTAGTGRLQIAPLRAASVVFPSLFTSSAGIAQASPLVDSVVRSSFGTSHPSASFITDTVAREACTVVELDDGDLHCVGSFGRVVFTDAACTTPAALASDAPTVAHELGGLLPDASDLLTSPAHQVYALGASIAGGAPAAYYTPDAQGTCGPTGTAPLVQALPQAASTFAVVHLVTD